MSAHTHTPVDLTDEQRANLNAAAQDLLAALELALPRLAHKHSCLSCRPIQEWEEFGSASFENCDCEIKIVRAAIAKATGYSSALAALNAETNEMVALSNGRLG